MADAGSGELMMARRSDRSKEDVSALPDDDKRMLDHLRTAVFGARQKMTFLKDEVNDRESAIEKEQSMRRAAEERLKAFLADMYASPEVNDELRQRLPRAKKGDPLKDKSEDDDLQLPEGGRRRRKQAGSDSEDMSSDYDDDQELGEDDNKKKGRKGRRKVRFGGGFPYYGSGQGMPMMYPAFMPSPYMGAPMYPPPPPGASPYYGAPASGQPGAAAAPPQAGGNEAASGDKSAQQSQEGVSGAVLERLVEGVRGSLEGEGKEYVRQISLLLSELDAAQALNRKLSEKLAGAEKEMASLQLQLESTETSVRAEVSAKVAEVTDEIYRAQRERDEALLGRVRVAQEEREAALERCTQLQALLHGRPHEHRVKDVQLDDEFDTEHELSSLLEQLDQSASPAAMTSAGQQLQLMVRSSGNRQRQASAAELRAVLQERDQAIAKMRQMETEMLALQRDVRRPAEHAVSGEDAVLKAKLLATQQERDLAVSKAQKLQEEMQTLQVYYSLHKSLSSERVMREDFNNTLTHVESQLQQKAGEASHAVKESNRMADHMRHAAEEREEMQAELEKMTAANSDARGQNQKLERLVGVLRRKLAAGNTPSPTE